MSDFISCRQCEDLIDGHCHGGSYGPWGPVPKHILDAEICKGHGIRAAPQPPVPVTLPADSAKRKAIPLAQGLLDYFPAALAAVAAVSKAGNDQHNPGQEMHHARGKSMDHADCIMRHLVDRGHKDADGLRHSAKVAWRSLALLQEELEREEGAPLPRGAKVT